MFLFRADGNPNIGAGHIMRCLSIADAAFAVGIPCLFVMADEIFVSTIAGRGHQAAVLDTDYSCMEEELKRGLFERIIRERHPSALIVDSYFVTYQYLLSLKKLCNEISCKLIYLDDVLAFPYPSDYLVNYNIYGPDKEMEYENMYFGAAKEEVPRFLLGTAFTPLRAEFQNLPHRRVKQQAKDIFLSTGGSDPEHMGLKLVEYIRSCTDESRRLDKFHFHLVIGGLNQDMDRIRKIAQGISNITLPCNVIYMQKLMSSCDVAVSAAGSTLYELCATQTPVITYILADNQIPGATGFEKHNVLTCCGDVRLEGAGKMARNVIEAAVQLADNYEERVRIASAQKRIVDGKGAGRIVEILMQKNKTI